MMKKQQQTESKENKFNKKFCTTGQNNDTDKDDVIRHHYFSGQSVRWRSVANLIFYEIPNPFGGWRFFSISIYNNLNCSAF